MLKLGAICGFGIIIFTSLNVMNACALQKCNAHVTR